MYQFSRVLVIYVACITFSFGACAGNPVVIIPGIMGSKLCSKDGSLLWGDRLSYTEKRLRKIRLPFKFDPDALDQKPCGIIESVNVIPLLWESNVYSGLINTLEGFGYNENAVLASKKIIIFDYDWRLSVDYNAKKLREKIDTLFPDKAQQVNILAHSMGGMIARIYVQQLGGADRVKHLIFMGTPSRGSAKIFKRLKEGLDNWPSGLSGGIQEIQSTILSFQATYQLLPSYDDCCGFSESGRAEEAKYFNIFEESNWKKFSWLPPEYVTVEGQDFIRRNLAEAKALHASGSNLTFGALV
jgi:hypothetical protein